MKKDKKKKENLKPNPFAYAFYTFCCKVFCFFKGVKIDRKVFKEQIKKSKKNKKGFILIYNHHSSKDHFVVASALNGHKTNLVLAKYFSYHKVIAKVTSWVKAISKDQFKADLSSIRKMKRAIDRPGIIGIAPAGQISIDGGKQFVSKGIVKLIRFCKADVIGLKMYGNHLAYPKWRKSKRTTKMSAEFVKVVYKEELTTISDDELFARVCDVACVDAFEVQKEKMNKIKGKNLSAGLESELYVCPKCGAKHQNISVGNELICQKCGNTVVYTEYGFLEPKDNKSVAFSTEIKWYSYQKDLIKNSLIHDENFHLIGEFDLYRNLNKENELEKFGEGVLHYTKDRFYFEGTLNNQPYVKEFSHNSIFQLPYSPSNHFFVPDDEGPFKFIPTKNKTCVNEWVQTVDAMREIKEAEGRVF